MLRVDPLAEAIRRHLADVAGEDPQDRPSSAVEQVPVSQPRWGATLSVKTPHDSVVRALRHMRARGWNHFDCAVLPGQLYPDEMVSLDRRHLRRHLEQDEILIDSLNLLSQDLNLCSGLKDDRECAIAHVKSTLRLAQDIDARAVVVASGRPCSPLISEDESLRWLDDSLQKLTSLAASLEVTLLLCSLPCSLISSARGVADLVDRFNSEYLRIAYDLSAAGLAGEDHGEAIRMLDDRTQQVLVPDCLKATSRRLSAVSPAVLTSVLAAAANINFRGTLILDLDSDRTVAEVRSEVDELISERQVQTRKEDAHSHICRR